MNNKAEQRCVRSEEDLTGADAIRLIRAVKVAYRKHHLRDDFIGWEELSDLLQDELCNAIGSDAFCDWLDSLKRGER